MLEKIRLILIDHLGLQDGQSLAPHIKLLEDLGADSLDKVELAMELEDQFDIDIGDKETEELITVGDLIRLVEGKLCEQ